MQAVKNIVAGPVGQRRMRPVNDIVVEQIDALGRVARELIADGHTVIGVNIEPTGGLPTVQLASSSRLAAMVEADQATYYRRQTDPLGITHTGQFQAGGVRVVWLELERH